MPSSSDKWIRSVKDNPAGKVVADPEGNRWEWQSEDDTAHLLKALSNDELAIEKTDLRPASRPREARNAAPTPVKGASRRPEPGTPDSGGGFNPYDHPGKNKKRR